MGGGGGMPFIRFSIDDNEWGMSSSEVGDLVHFDWDSPVLVDVERIDLGWLKLMGGRDFQEWPRDEKGEHTPTPRPSDEYKQAFRVKFFSTKLFSDAPVRELSSDRAGLLEFIRKLHDEAEPKFGKGEIPAIKMLKALKVRIGKGPTKIPQFEIVGWKPRPEEMEDRDDATLVYASQPDDIPFTVEPKPDPKPDLDDNFNDVEV